MIDIHFRRRKELDFIDIKYSGLSEAIFDTIVSIDESNTNEEKISILFQRFTKFLRKNKPFFRI